MEARGPELIETDDVDDDPSVEMYNAHSNQDPGCAQ